jgi:Zn-finger nucleic acid-binding protein
MNCRNCAAAMEPVGGRAYFRCGHCGTFEFPQTNDDGVAAVGEITEFSCPVCAQPLTTAAIDGHTICYCGTCRGFLTTNPNFTAILATRREHFADTPSVPRSFAKDELRRRIGCPKCKKKMDTHPYGGGGNVVVDTCCRCVLIWLDAGEIEVLARHRPKEGVADRLMPTGVTPQYDGAPREPQSPLRWGWEDNVHSRYDDGSEDLWTVLKRLF